jgi:hypothetical protein
METHEPAENVTAARDVGGGWRIEADWTAQADGGGVLHLLNLFPVQRQVRVGDVCAVVSPTAHAEAANGHGVHLPIVLVIAAACLGADTVRATRRWRGLLAWSITELE